MNKDMFVQEMMSRYGKAYQIKKEKDEAEKIFSQLVAAEKIAIDSILQDKKILYVESGGSTMKTYFLDGECVFLLTQVRKIEVEGSQGSWPKYSQYFKHYVEELKTIDGLKNLNKEEAFEILKIFES